MSDSLAPSLTVAHQAPLSMEFPGKNTGVDCHLLLQGIVPTQGLNPHLLHWQPDSLPLSHQGSPMNQLSTTKGTLLLLNMLKYMYFRLVRKQYLLQNLDILYFTYFLQVLFTFRRYKNQLLKRSEKYYVKYFNIFNTVDKKEFKHEINIHENGIFF